MPRKKAVSSRLDTTEVAKVQHVMLILLHAHVMKDVSFGLFHRKGRLHRKSQCLYSVIVLSPKLVEDSHYWL